MSAVFDAASSASHAGGAASTLSWTHTPVGTPTAVGVAVTIRFGTSWISGVTYGGVAMTQAIADADDFDPAVGIFRLANPPAGPQTVTVTQTGTAEAQAFAVTVTGSDTATVFRATASNKGVDTAPTVSVTSAIGDLVMAIVGQKADTGSAMTPGAGQTDVAGTVQVNRMQGSTKAGASSVDMSYSAPGSSSWAMAAASFMAGPAAATAGVRGLLAFWMGGASASSAPPAPTAGFRGLMAFWMGGGSPDTGAVVTASGEWIVQARRRGKR